MEEIPENVLDFFDAIWDIGLSRNILNLSDGHFPNGDVNEKIPYGIIYELSLGHNEHIYSKLLNRDEVSGQP